ncbi:hypothetical protein Y032_0720g1817 [Ancylostoma ceylanicum]|uniref:Uncharacterized protein n=1 Tax=Ancylostoma ceylanicum TaxID=53326 RepID=A0A016WFH4_9BILA|nr:hypothetical protein Y032_0720g1817 [Ancylostoma ceylanicum]
MLSPHFSPRSCSDSAVTESVYLLEEFRILMGCRVLYLERAAWPSFVIGQFTQTANRRARSRRPFQV